MASRLRLSTLTYALACLIDPPTLVAVGLLLLNDHIFNWLTPSWLTRKLSDLTGLFFFPFWLGWRNMRQAIERSPEPSAPSAS